jgi:glycosyltransferase involved in cell wall biosynthesis
MRALHVLESFAAGGIETTFLNMLRAWRDEPAWASHHVLALGGGPLEEPYRAICGSVTVTSDPDELERVTTQGFDVVYVLFDRVAYRLLPWLVGHAGAAVVYGKGYDMGCMFRADAGLRWQADESLMWGTDATTFTTVPLSSLYDAPASRAAVLGKAADVRHFFGVPRLSGDAPRRIVCVANLHARKRLGDLLAVTAELRRSLPDVRVRLVGADDGREAERLRATADSLGLGAACEIVGRRSDVAADLRDSRIFALPSACEGVPTAMLEAMAAGRPVVMTDIGHVRSVVRDGIDGFLVPPGDLSAFADRLHRLITDAALAARMGAAARARAHIHDTHAVAARLRSVLESAAKDYLA